MDKGPLFGIKVLELANVLAGPSVGVALAELGATVIKVENLLTRGDVTRTWKLPTENPDTDISGYFSCVNWGKKSIALNLNTSEGLELVYRLAEICDIVLASYKPGDAEKLKVDYPTLKKYNNKLIYAHLTGYGLKNMRAGYDAIIQAESGFTYMNGEPDGNPVKMPVALMDVLAGHQLKEAILLALLTRERKGEGTYIETSLIKSGIASLANQATNWLVGNKIPERMGSDHPNIVPYGRIFYTRDQKPLVLAVGNDKQFADLCKVLGDESIATDTRFANNFNRVKNRDVIYSLLQDLIARYDREHLLKRFAEMRIPAGGVYNMQEVFEQPEAKEMLMEGTTTSGMAIRGVRSVAFTMSSGSEANRVSAPPHYAEHTKLVLNEMLGLSSSAIQNLIDKNVVYAQE